MDDRIYSVVLLTVRVSVSQRAPCSRELKLLPLIPVTGNTTQQLQSFAGSFAPLLNVKINLFGSLTATSAVTDDAISP